MICSHWLRLREERIVAKGKGELITFWLEVKSSTTGSKSSYSSGNCNDISKNSSSGNDLVSPTSGERSKKSQKLLIEKIDRLVDWNTDNLVRLLQQIVDFRQYSGTEDESCIDLSFEANPFDEVKEIIALPQVKNCKSASIESLPPISAIVSGQLRDYVCSIAHMYNENFFHNFEHVSTRVRLLLTVIFICH